uniref:Dolichol-phosphate mannosyltransferase subunit 3 n=1 Tax=Timema bartmani TaxID=61472 RepID=A0A7R9I4P7_9NEOP|nr:unnamed protein product [Timema bartmani]
MTKLMEWIFGAILFLGVWAALLTFHLNSGFLKDYSDVIIPFPLIVLVYFGLYAATVILWRVFTFNDCEDAAKELQQQIIEAKEDLQSKGFLFEEK